MWRRVIRSRGFILFVFVVIFSFGVLGQVDNRMHIGGSDWDLDSLIYINVDEFLVDEANRVGTVSLDGVTGYVAKPQPQPQPQPQPESLEDVGANLDVQVGVKRQEIALEKSTILETVSSESIKEQVVPPVAEPPKVEEKKEERPTIFVHKVHSGETLWDIANAYGITVDTILSANDLRDPNRISIGQELQILSVQGVLHSVATGESLWEIAERYKIPVDEIAQANSISDPSRLQPNTKIVIPGATRLMPRDVLIVNGQLQKAFDWPTRGRISSPFGPRWGKMHNGLDIAVPTGTPIKSAGDGRVSFAGWNGGYGILVIVDHGNGVETRYAHNSRLNVKVGQKVERGQVISYSGNTGVSTGPHLHFEIRHRNNPVNPQTYLK